MLLPITDGEELTASMSRRAGRETWLTLHRAVLPTGTRLRRVGVVVVVRGGRERQRRRLGTEVALFEPELFDAVTRTRTVLPTLLLVSV